MNPTDVDKKPANSTKALLGFIHVHSHSNAKWFISKFNYEKCKIHRFLMSGIMKVLELFIFEM